MKLILKLYAVLLAAVALLWPARPAHADQLVWSLPGGVGTVGLPFQATEALYGYDFALKQNIVGASLPVLTIKDIVSGQVGAVGAFASQSLNVQPYLGLGVDILRFVPTLNEFKSLHLNGFGRWATDQGKLGGGLSLSYSFGQ